MSLELPQREALGARRIAAVVLPDLLLEATLKLEAKGASALSQKPFAVVAVPDAGGRQGAEGEQEVTPLHRLQAVSPMAKSLGVQVGSRITEAQAVLARLEVRQISIEELSRLLLAVAEVLRSFGSTVSLSSWLKTIAESASDLERFQLCVTLPCVWVDVSGVGHLYGSETELGLEMRERVRLLGHSARVVIANGPELARAMATYGELGSGGVRVIEGDAVRRAISELPILALPLDAEKFEFLARLGFVSVSELAALPRAVLSSRLGAYAAQVFDLLEGIDDTPLLPCAFPELVEERVEFEDEAHNLEPILFALRGMVARASARLGGRGQASGRLLLTLHLNLRRSPGDLRRSPGDSRRRLSSPRLELVFELAAPVWREGELFRILRGRLEKVKLESSCVGLHLALDKLDTPLVTQLQMGQKQANGALEQSELPILLWELENDVGKDRVGALRVGYHHKPEEQSSLETFPSLRVQARRRVANAGRSHARRVALDRRSKNVDRRPSDFDSPRAGEGNSSRDCDKLSELDRVTRLFVRAVPLAVPLAVGQTLLFMRSLYTIEKLRFVERLEGVAWWTQSSTSRDYFWAILSGPEATLEALVYVDRKTGERYLQGLKD